jgi:hypothetical protein
VICFCDWELLPTLVGRHGDVGRPDHGWLDVVAAEGDTAEGDAADGDAADGDGLGPDDTTDRDGLGAADLAGLGERLGLGV